MAGTDHERLELEKIDGALTVVRAEARGIGSLVVPVIEDANAAFEAVNPQLVGRDYELRETWPLASKSRWLKFLGLQFSDSIDRAQQPDEQHQPVPKPLYGGGVRFWAMADAYRGNEPNYVPREELPGLAVRLTQDLAEWADEMAERGHDLRLMAEVWGEGHDVCVIAYEGSEEADAYLEWRAGGEGDFEHTFFSRASEAVHASPRVTVGAMDGIEQILPELAQADAARY